MGIFDPKIDVELTPERTIPVPQVSGVGGMEAATTLAQGAGNFASALLSGLGGSGGSRSGGGRTIESKQQQFVADFARVSQIQDPARRQQFERKLSINAMADGVDLGFQNKTKATYTGVPVEMGYADIQEQNTIKFLEDPDNGPYINWASQKLGEDAPLEMVVREAELFKNSKELREKEREFNLLGSADKVNNALAQLTSDKELATAALVAKNKEGKPVYQQEIDMTRALLRSNYNELNRTYLADIPDEEKKVFVQEYERQIAALDALEKVTVSALAETQMATVQAGIQQHLFADPNVSNTEAIATMGAISRLSAEDMIKTGAITATTPASVQESLGKMGKALDVGEAAAGPEGAAVDTTGMGSSSTALGAPLPGADDYGDDVRAGIEKIDANPTMTLDRIDTLTKLIDADTFDMGKNPNAVENLKQHLTIVGEAWFKLGDKDQQWITAPKTQAVSLKVKAGIDTLAQSDILAAATASRKMAKATATMAEQARQALKSMEAQFVVRVDEGKVVFDKEKFLASGEFSPENLEAAEAAANRYYGGDILALLQDAGARIPPAAGGISLNPGSDTASPELDLLKTRILQTIQDKVPSPAQLKLLNEQLAAVQTLRTASDEFLSMYEKYGVPSAIAPVGTPAALQGGLEPTAGELTPALTSGGPAPADLPTDSFQAPEAGVTEAPAEETTVTPEQAIAPTEGASEGQQAITEAITPAAPTSRADITKAARAQAAEEGYQEGTPAFTARSSAIQRELLQQGAQATEPSVQPLAYAPASGTTQGEAYNIPSAVSGDTEFMGAVQDLASRKGWNAQRLIDIMDFETGGSFAPDQKNLAGSGATGLIQFTDKTLGEWGLTTDDIKGMTRTEQLALVEKHMSRHLEGIENPTFSDMYMSVIWPDAVGKPETHVLFKKGSKYYEQNDGLDISGDGTITKGEAAEAAMSKLLERRAKETGVAVPLMASRDQLSASERKSVKGKRLVSLDFNGAEKKARGVEIIIPNDATPEERAAAEAYVQQVSEFFKANGLADYPIRGVRTTKENKGRGMSGYFHTEPFFNSDPEAAQVIKDNLKAYSQVLAGTLGQIPGVRFIAPHTKKAQGAVLDDGTTERALGLRVLKAMRS